MKILVTNDDGFNSKGLKVLTEILKDYGTLTVVAPKKPQSGMSMAVTMGFKPIAVKHLEPRDGQDWWYLDGTPASCVKYGIDNVLYPQAPDLVVSGINHGSNAATAAIYSGTIGAAMEGAVNLIPAVGVSLDCYDPDADFSAVKEYLPGILDKIIANLPRPRRGGFININFPNPETCDIKGIKVTNMGFGHWEREYRDYDEFLKERGRTPDAEAMSYIAAKEEGEEIVVMAGDFVSNEGNSEKADHILLEQGWITITPHNIDNTDYQELERLCDII